jgi:site-specific DNA recombinase
VEDAVWAAVAEALRRPELLVGEYQRRLVESGSVTDLEFEQKQVSLALKRVTGREDRITDAYVNEAMDLERYKAEMGRLRAEREELQRMVEDIDRRQQQEKDGHSALEHLERFCNQVAKGLEAMAFEERQQLLRLVVERITVEDSRVRVETIIPTGQDDVKLRKLRSELVEP